MRISDRRYRRELLRYQVARRMVSLGAHRRTILRWTGLSGYCVKWLVRDFREDADPRPRGPTPTAAAIFTKSKQHEAEAIALVVVALQMEILPAEALQGSFAWEPDLLMFDRLIQAYGTYRTLAPATVYCLEHMHLLMRELAEGKTLSLATCERCRGLMLRSRAVEPVKSCASCRKDRARHSSPANQPSTL